MTLKMCSFDHNTLSQITWMFQSCEKNLDPSHQKSSTSGQTDTFNFCTFLPQCPKDLALKTQDSVKINKEGQESTLRQVTLVCPCTACL